MGTMQTKEKHCKSCFHILDAHTAVEGSRMPKKDDLSICVYCGKISTFDEDFNLVAMSDEQISEMEKTDHSNFVILQKASLFIEQRNKLN